MLLFVSPYNVTSVDDAVTHRCAWDRACLDCDRRPSVSRPPSPAAVQTASNGMSLTEIVSGLLHATDPDAAVDAAHATTGLEDPPESAVFQAREKLLDAAVIP